MLLVDLYSCQSQHAQKSCDALPREYSGRGSRPDRGWWRLTSQVCHFGAKNRLLKQAPQVPLLGFLSNFVKCRISSTSWKKLNAWCLRMIEQIGLSLTPISWDYKNCQPSTQAPLGSWLIALCGWSPPSSPIFLRMMKKCGFLYSIWSLEVVLFSPALSSFFFLFGRSPGVGEH